MWYVRMASTVGLKSPCNAVHISLIGGRPIPHKSPAYVFESATKSVFRAI